MIACSAMKLEKEEHGSLQGHWRSTRVLHTWMWVYVGEEEEWNAWWQDLALESTHDCMQYNAIGEGGARELARVLELNTCITHLNVRVCLRREAERTAWQQDEYS